MIAGLLGEHLASPRTATKTNQNTALETNTKRDSTPPSEDGFAAYVAKDTDGASQETPSAEEAIAAADSTAGTSDVPLPAALDGEYAGTDLAATEAAETNTSETVRSQNTNTDTIKAEAITPDPRLAKDAAPTDAAGEIASEDPRVRAAANPQDSHDGASSSGTGSSTSKLAHDGTPDLANAAPDRGAQSALDSAVAGRTEADSTDADALRTAHSVDGTDSRQATESEAQVRAAAAEANRADLTVTPAVSRDTPMFGAEPTVTIGLAATGSAPAQVNVGLTPTPAAIPVAAPSDLTSVILNAVKNGADPQEQLVVQLDPPELGRVMIDFKFDAQGVQQITVTSENPEALKRLRELHFELTQALRENGLSDQNMSFRQEAGEQSQNTRQHQDQQRSNAPLIAAEDRRASPSAIQALPNAQARDRLDLLL